MQFKKIRSENEYLYFIETSTKFQSSLEINLASKEEFDESQKFVLLLCLA